MKILRYILSLLIGIYLWNALDQIYWTTGLKSQELQLNINARLAITPLQLERKIVSPIEYILKDFSNVKNFSSFISDQYARIIIQLKPKTDVDKFKIQVNEKFRQNWAEWKLTIKYPTWQKEMNSNRQKVSYAGIPLNGNLIPCPYYLPDDFVLIDFSYNASATNIQQGDRITISGSEVYEVITGSYNQFANTSGLLFCARVI